MNPHHFSTVYTWDLLTVNANRMKLVNTIRKWFESHLSAGATEKLPEWQKLNAKTVAWSYDMEGHAQKCVERSCELANKTIQSLKFLLG